MTNKISDAFTVFVTPKMPMAKQQTQLSVTPPHPIHLLPSGSARKITTIAVTIISELVMHVMANGSFSPACWKKYVP
jgi:hypothetical protein